MELQYRCVGVWIVGCIFDSVIDIGDVCFSGNIPVGYLFLFIIITHRVDPEWAVISATLSHLFT